MSVSLPREAIWVQPFRQPLGSLMRNSIIGIHLNYIAGRFLLGGTLNQTPDDEITKSLLAELRAWWDLEGSYSHVQSTKPETLGYALNDSPVGLAAWIVEKFRTWSDCAGERFGLGDVSVPAAGIPSVHSLHRCRLRPRGNTTGAMAHRDGCEPPTMEGAGQRRGRMPILARHAHLIQSLRGKENEHKMRI
jgi:hypothetical protein